MNHPVLLLAAAMRAYDRAHTLERCDTCSATWDSQEGTGCQWCVTALENQRRWQAELVLAPPDVNPDDITYDGVMTGWAERLAVAVEAELIPRSKAETAWKRATSDVPRVSTLSGDHGGSAM